MKNYGGDFAHTTMKILISKISDDPYQREASRRKLAQLRAVLGARSAIERLLVERILLAWLDCSHRELMSLANLDEMELAGRCECWTRRAGQAQRRMVQALRPLETVRVKELPIVPAKTPKVRVDRLAGMFGGN